MIELLISNILLLILCGWIMTMYRRDTQSLMNRLSEQNGQMDIFHAEPDESQVMYVDEPRERELDRTKVTYNANA